MQCACTILSSVSCPAVQYFSTLSPKRHFLGGGGDSSLELLCETFLIVIRIVCCILRCLVCIVVVVLCVLL